MRIESHCIRNPFTVAPDQPVQVAAEIMKRHHVGCLVVVEDGAPVGMLTDRDIATRLVAQERSPAHTQVGAVMSPELVTLQANSSVSEATRTMRDHALRRLPVVDSAGKLAGILTSDDLFVMLARQLGGMADALEEGLAGEAFPLGDTLAPGAVGGRV